MQLSDKGEPIYGPRDEVNLADMKALELPFWMAGNYATPEKLKEVQASGAHGIQAGTLFAFANESGVKSELKLKVIQKRNFWKPHLHTLLDSKYPKERFSSTMRKIERLLV